MILVYAIILLILLALLFRRDLGLIAQRSYRGGWRLLGLIAGLFVLQAVMVLYAPGQTRWQMAILVLTQSAIIGLLFLNRHLPGAKIFALGLVLNLVVMAANGGWMPVTPETSSFVHPARIVEVHTRPPSSKNIVLARSETRLWVLSDIIRLTLPWRRTAVSIGDILLIVGAGQFIFQATTKEKNDR